jgi:hypothetical protein
MCRAYIPRREMKQKRPSYSGSERDLCDLFREVALANGWTVYPETAGWDMLAVKTVEDGEISVGVQAKLHFNTHLLAQTIGTRSEVNYKVALVPYKSDDSIVATELGVVPMSMCDGVGTGLLTDYDRFAETNGFTFFHPVSTPAFRPDICPDWMGAGVPAPRTIGYWMQQAIKFIATVNLRDGVVTTADLKAFKMKASMWLRRGWIRKVSKTGRSWQYAFTENGWKRPDILHKDYYDKMCDKIGQEKVETGIDNDVQ